LALNNNYAPVLSDAQVAYYLNNPKLATAAKYQLHDDKGHSMDVPTIIQMTGQPYKYAAVYHTGTCVANCTPGAAQTIRFSLNLAVSNDLITWTFVRQLVDNADMPRMVQVSGASWILLAHEQWQGPGPGSSAPTAATFELFYDFNDLMNGTIRSTWSMPIYNSPNNINGTPSIYDAHLALYNGYYSVDGQYGFHINQGTALPTDVNGVTTILKLFDPTGGTTGYPSTATNYNNLMIAKGAVNEIGGRDTLLTTTARFNLQEGHAGTGWDTWRVWLYKFAETTNYPTGAGTATQLNPQTPGGSTSFANPSIAVVDRPGGGGKALVVSYFIFDQNSENGSLIYYFNI